MKPQEIINRNRTSDAIVFGKILEMRNHDKSFTDKGFMNMRV